MIDILALIGHWCASCVPAGVGVAPTLGALSGAAAAASGISGLGDLANDGGAGPNDGGVGDVSGAPAGAGAGADGAGSSAAGAGTGSADSSPYDAGAPGAPEPASPTSTTPAADTPPGDAPTPPPGDAATPPAPEGEPGPEGETEPARTGPYEEPGWIDNALGLNPETSFVQAGMDGLGYGPTGIWGRPIAPGDSDLTTLGRALGAAAVSPATAFAVVIGHGLDDLNHGPEEAQAGAGVSAQLNDPPPNPPPNPQSPAPSHPQSQEPASPPDKEPPTSQ